MTFPRHRPLRSLALLLAAGLLATSLAGCATRNSRHQIINRRLVKVDLVREVRGFSTVEKGYEHPKTISRRRLENILGAVEVETRAKGAAFYRGAAFHPDIRPYTAEALAEALAEAGPDEEIAVSVIRKEMRLGILHKKFLTTFIAYVDEGHLFLFPRRIEWPMPRTDKNIDHVWKPRRDTQVMDFRVIGGEPLYYAGPQALEIDWRSKAFETAFRLPGATESGKRRRREVLESTPIPREERVASEAGEELLAVDELSAEQLRALADLEEDRREGRITELAYQRAKRQLLRRRPAEP